jgi:hypothetical protein
VRRVLGYVLLGLGVFLLVLAPLIKFVAVPKLAVAPMNLDPNSPSRSSGLAVKLLDFKTLTERENVPLTQIRFTKADDVAAAQAGGNTAVYESFSRVNDADGLLVTAGTERYTFERTNNIIVIPSSCDVTAKPPQATCSNIDGVVLTADNLAGDAIMPLKLPFFLDKAKSYNYYDTTLGKGAPVSFTEETAIDGLTVYKYEGTIEPVQVGTVTGAGSLVGSTEKDAPRFYGNHRTLYVEPITGQVINGIEDQKQTLRGPDGSDKITIIEGKIGFTDEEIAESVGEAKTNSSKLKLLTTTLPVGALVGGLVALAVGLLLLLGRRDADDEVPPAGHSA